MMPVISDSLYWSLIAGLIVVIVIVRIYAR